jgi:hypothetical protein
LADDENDGPTAITEVTTAAMSLEEARSVAVAVSSSVI